MENLKVRKIIVLLSLCVFTITSLGCVRGVGSRKADGKDLLPVHMVVDFGPAGKARHEEKLFVEKGTTPKEAVSQLFPVLSGKACCSLREVIEIGGVRIDPAKNRWWICEVNGSRDVTPHKAKLESGDKVLWVYFEDSQ